MPGQFPVLFFELYVLPSKCFGKIASIDILIEVPTQDYLLSVLPPYPQLRQQVSIEQVFWTRYYPYLPEVS